MIYVKPFLSLSVVKGSVQLASWMMTAFPRVTHAQKDTKVDIVNCEFFFFQKLVINDVLQSRNKYPATLFYISGLVWLFCIFRYISLFSFVMKGSPKLYLFFVIIRDIDIGARSLT